MAVEQLNSKHPQQARATLQTFQLMFQQVTTRGYLSANAVHLDQADVLAQLEAITNTLPKK